MADVATEPCDGLDLRGETCESLGFVGGELTCHPQCYAFNASNCDPYGSCCTQSSCIEATSEAACSGAGGTFVANAPKCTPNLCAAALQNALTPQDAQQPSSSAIELGTRTTSTRQAVPSESGNGCTSFCFVGTVGGMLRSVSNGTLYLVSNAHVWASPAGYEEADNCARSSPPRNGADQVYQSGTCDLLQSAHIGNLHAFSELTPNSVQRVDVALASVDGGVESAASPVQMGLGAQQGGAAATPTLGMIVVKSSRTSGFRIGQISGIDVTINVLYGSDDGTDSNYMVRFENQLYLDGISPSSSFVVAGDSGSMIFEYGTMRAVGVVFAGGALGEGVVTPMSEVFDAFFPGNDGEVAGPPVSSTTKRSALRHPSGAFVPKSRFINELPSATAVQHACAAKHGLAAALDAMMLNNTVVAHYVSLRKDHSEQPCIVVLLNREHAAQHVDGQFPSQIDGVPLFTRYTDTIRAA